MAGCAKDTAMSAGRHIAAGPGVGLLHGAGGENPLLLDQNRTGLVAALLVLPDPRGDILNRIDNVLRPVIADHAVRPLGGIAADRHGRVDQEIEPVDRLLDPGAALGPDRAVIFTACEALRNAHSSSHGPPCACSAM